MVRSLAVDGSIAGHKGVPVRGLVVMVVVVVTVFLLAAAAAAHHNEDNYQDNTAAANGRQQYDPQRDRVNQWDLDSLCRIRH